MKTVLIYVLSSVKPPYGEMIRTAQETWDAEPLDGTRTVFYCGKPVVGNTSRIVSFPVEDELLSVGRITVAAFAHALGQWQWDYLARPNISCYVHKKRLLTHCQSLPDRCVIQGVACGPTWVCGIQRPFLWGGGQFILSRDVVENLVGQQHKWQHSLMEDVAISELAQGCGYALDGTGRMCSLNKNGAGWDVISYGGKPGFSFVDWKDVSKIDDQFFLRVKHDPDRSVDSMVMRLLKQHLPP